jgi:hypothetical protein
VSERPAVTDDPTVDVGDYCRRIEAHLTRVNEGQLIRIVGPAFALARAWALEGIPLSVVCHGIDQKAERHRAGRSRRPLRLEFCEADVVTVYTQWQRAVGVRRAGAGAVNEAAVSIEPDQESRPQALSRQLERVIDKLSRLVGRLDLSDRFREDVGRVLQEVSDLRETIKGTRGAARAELLERLPALDGVLIEAARAELGTPGLDALERQASAELSAFRSRLTPEAWSNALALSVVQLIRAHLGLPTLIDS